MTCITQKKGKNMPGKVRMDRERGPRRHHIRDIKLAHTPLLKAQAARAWLEEANRRKSRWDASLEVITDAMKRLELEYIKMKS